MSAADSSALAHSTLPALPPLRVASPPVALAGGGPLQAVLVGWGIAGAGTTLHCRSRGHTVVLTVLQARRGGGGDDGDEELDEPGTPSTTENPSLAAPSSSDGGSRSRGPAPLDARGAPPSQAALLLERVELAGGEDAVVVTLPAALAWGLVEFEAAQGRGGGGAGAGGRLAWPGPRVALFHTLHFPSSLHALLLPLHPL